MSTDLFRSARAAEHRAERAAGLVAIAYRNYYAAKVIGSPTASALYDTYQDAVARHTRATTAASNVLIIAQNDAIAKGAAEYKRCVPKDPIHRTSKCIRADTE